MVNNRYETLVERLVDKTNRNELDWKESPIVDSFQISLASHSVLISERRTASSDEIDYMITVINSEGNVVDTFSDVDLGSGYFARLRDLYQNARRKALGVDKALDAILKELDDDIPF